MGNVLRGGQRLQSPDALLCRGEPGDEFPIRQKCSPARGAGFARAGRSTAQPALGGAGAHPGGAVPALCANPPGGPAQFFPFPAHPGQLRWPGPAAQPGGRPDFLGYLPQGAAAVQRQIQPRDAVAPDRRRVSAQRRAPEPQPPFRAAAHESAIRKRLGGFLDSAGEIKSVLVFCLPDCRIPGRVFEYSGGLWGGFFRERRLFCAIWRGEVGETSARVGELLRMFWEIQGGDYWLILRERL